MDALRSSCMRKAIAIVLDETQRQTLEPLKRSRTAPVRLVERATIVRVVAQHGGAVLPRPLRQGPQRAWRNDFDDQFVG